MFTDKKFYLFITYCRSITEQIKSSLIADFTIVACRFRRQRTLKFKKIAHKSRNLIQTMQ